MVLPIFKKLHVCIDLRRKLIATVICLTFVHLNFVFENFRLENIIQIGVDENFLL